MPFEVTPTGPGRWVQAPVTQPAELQFLLYSKCPTRKAATEGKPAECPHENASIDREMARRGI